MRGELEGPLDDSPEGDLVIGERSIASVGAGAVRIAQEVGGIVVLTGQVLRALVPPRIDGRELVKNLYKMGNRSVPIVVLTAFFAGGLMIAPGRPVREEARRDLARRLGRGLRRAPRDRADPDRADVLGPRRREQHRRARRR